MTKDGVVMVTHDTSLRRCTGRNENIYLSLIHILGANRSVSDQSCCIRGTNSRFVAALYRTMTASRGILSLIHI